MELSPIELKFLLRLLEHSPNYRTRISRVKPNAKTNAGERDRICKSLCSKGLVDYIDEVGRYRTTAAGKILLTLDSSVLPVTPDELLLLKTAATQTATPDKAKKVSPIDRQRLLHQLEGQGLINVSKSQIKEVWLTPQGQRYLRNECNPTSSASLPLSMMGHYLMFLRQFIDENPSLDTELVVAPTPAANALTSADVLTMIQQLDQQLGTENYLPIFHLREKLQPPFSREELDQQLYELERLDCIELSTLQDVSAYGEDQLAAGIPQDMGGALFFISLLESEE